MMPCRACCARSPTPTTRVARRARELLDRFDRQWISSNAAQAAVVELVSRAIDGRGKVHAEAVTALDLVDTAWTSSDAARAAVSRLVRALADADGWNRKTARPFSTASTGGGRRTMPCGQKHAPLRDGWRNPRRPSPSGMFWVPCWWSFRAPRPGRPCSPSRRWKELERVADARIVGNLAGRGVGRRRRRPRRQVAAGAPVEAGGQRLRRRAGYDRACTAIPAGARTGFRRFRQPSVQWMALREPAGARRGRSQPREGAPA